MAQDVGVGGLNGLGANADEHADPFQAALVVLQTEYQKFASSRQSSAKEKKQLEDKLASAEASLAVSLLFCSRRGESRQQLHAAGGKLDRSFSRSPLPSRFFPPCSSCRPKHG